MFDSLLLQRGPSGGRGADAGRGDGEGVDVDVEDDTKAEEAIVCAFCGASITSERAQAEVSGRHAHTFMNPSAVVFHIACFRAAPGCVVLGAATDEYSWFPGFAWRFAHCGECRMHLGWSFEPDVPQNDDGAAFFGLIEDRLVRPSG